jgi:hypothetical protein
MMLTHHGEFNSSSNVGCACGEPAISHDSHHVSLVQWTNLFASRHKGNRFKSPGGDLYETGILLLALYRYIGGPAVIDHQQGFVPNCH